MISFIYLGQCAWAENVAFPGGGGYVVGVASYYGAAYRGRLTASGERFDPSDLTAAHPHWPMGTLVEVFRLDRHGSVVVRVNDRGPSDGRILDLSEAAARRLGMIGQGTAPVSLSVIGRAE